MPTTAQRKHTCSEATAVTAFFREHETLPRNTIGCKPAGGLPPTASSTGAARALYRAARLGRVPQLLAAARPQSSSAALGCRGAVPAACGSAPGGPCRPRELSGPAGAPGWRRTGVERRRKAQSSRGPPPPPPAAPGRCRRRGAGTR